MKFLWPLIDTVLRSKLAHDVNMLVKKVRMAGLLMLSIPTPGGGLLIRGLRVEGRVAEKSTVVAEFDVF